MANANATLDIIDKTFDGSGTPSVTGESVPIVFPENIPVLIEVECTFTQGNDEWRYLYTIEGYIDQYTYNNQYPHLYVNLIGMFNGVAHTIGIVCNNPSARFTGTSNEKRFQNGQKTTDYTQYTMTFSFQRSSDETYTKNLHIRILTSTIPVIFGDTSNVASELYSEKPNTYFQTDTSPTTLLVNKMPLILQGYNYKNTLNVVDEVIPDGVDFEIKNAWTYGEWTQYGQPAVNFVNYRCLRGRIITGRMCYYPVQGIEDGSLKYQIVSDATFYGLEVSTDGTSWSPIESNLLPFDFFYRPHVNELGAFNYGLTFSNDGIPRFKDGEEADDYIEEIINEVDADNWDEISGKYPDPQITIGEPDEDPTEMGEVYTRAFFSQQYICDAGAMSEISNALFDTDAGGLWEDIKKGLEMYGDSPVDDIQGCMYFPFPLAQVLTNTQSQNYIYFGGYRFDMQNSVQKIIYPNGFINFGTFNCPYRFGGSFRDYAPYRRLTVYLPYIGWAELDLKRYIGKSVNVRYYIDTRTGGCMACLFANEILYDYFNGQMGVSMPITATDYVAYANAQINTLLGGAGAMKNNAGNLASGAQSMIAQGVSAGSAIAGLAPVAGLAVGANVAKTMYGLTQNNINNFNVTKGASSSMLNCYLPQNVMFLDEVQKGQPTPNELSLMGYPSNASGNLQNFSGYLEVDAVNLICDTATDNERSEIMALLRSGVYI